MISGADRLGRPRWGLVGPCMHLIQHMHMFSKRTGREVVDLDIVERRHLHARHGCCCCWWCCSVVDGPGQSRSVDWGGVEADGGWMRLLVNAVPVSCRRARAAAILSADRCAVLWWPESDGMDVMPAMI